MLVPVAAIHDLMAALPQLGDSAVQDTEPVELAGVVFGAVV